MTAMTEECPIFENEEWLVTESGLEHKRPAISSTATASASGGRTGCGLGRCTWPRRAGAAMQPFTGGLLLRSLPSTGSRLVWSLRKR